ncbi:hypothetical protein M0R72_20180 [Candidatus Pacearchaeota archaeon]|jgi:hypothetical protein|nr:hypothetical protein [Candidatus Pacearchaeota archaeon]
MGLDSAGGRDYNASIFSVVYIQPRKGEIMVLRTNEILVIFILISGASRQDDFDEPPPDIIPIESDYPMVFPEPMQQASHAIEVVLSDAFGKVIRQNSFPIGGLAR